MHGWHTGGAVFMWTWWILALVVIITVIVIPFWVTARGRNSGGRALRETPEQILKRRYVAGEIDKDEYERKLADIRD